MERSFILGGGMTGLAAGYASGLPVYEASEVPGGICCSYYMRPHATERLHQAPSDDEAYRFEIGGGHWIFGGDPAILEFISGITGIEVHHRKSSVFFPAQELYVPYPLQNHLRFLKPELSSKALIEMSKPASSFQTMKDWLGQSFGPTLCELFFDGFHDLYTAGLYDRIAPQDAYKSPVDLPLVIQGTFGGVAAVGYNTSFIYPTGGLDMLARRMAEKCDVRYEKRATRVDPVSRLVEFSDGSVVKFERLISTLPLSTMMRISGLSVDAPADPHTSVLVLNIGARRGPRCPDDHWIYVPSSKSGFHRIGSYSAVDRRFLPASARPSQDRVSLYIERAYLPEKRPSKDEQQAYMRDVVRELQDFEYITDVEVVDPTWIEVAYTWSWPNSKWKSQALRKLQEHNIFQVGRYGRWVFQGIADSLRDGFIVGSSLRER
jgi:protoporphyrinogen oxidase